MELQEVCVVITLGVFNICWGVMASLPVRTLLVRKIGSKTVAGTSLPHGGIRERSHRVPDQSRWMEFKRMTSSVCYPVLGTMYPGLFFTSFLVPILVNR